MQNIENRPLTFLHKQRGISEQISMFNHQLSIQMIVSRVKIDLKNIFCKGQI